VAETVETKPQTPLDVTPAPPLPAVPVSKQSEVRAEVAVPTQTPLPLAGPAVVSSEVPKLPAALPPSVTEDPLKWKPNQEKPPVDEWNKSGQQLRSVPAGTTGSQPVAATARNQLIARGQAADDRVDPTISLIRKICEGRAEGVDIRWTGSKKLTVCFECQTAPDAQKLVKDISARPELASLQIDFCVLVK
jgi:hypothetical protein